MAHNTQKGLDPEFEALVKEVADEMGIPTGIGREAYLKLMEHAVKKMRQMVPVNLPNMGLFYLSTTKTRERILRMIASYRSGVKGVNPEAMTLDQIKERLPMYWGLHNIAKSHYPKTGAKYRREKRLEWVAEQKKLKEQNNE